MDPTTDLNGLVQKLHDVCEALATGSGASYEDYETARLAVLEASPLAAAIPEWLRVARSGSQFWAFIKQQHGTYAGRRTFLASQLHPLFSIAELGTAGPILTLVSSLANVGTPDSVKAAWQKCLDRLDQDPEGAITAARTMLESTCKCILEDSGVLLTGREDAPKLYGLVAERLMLSPSAHDEPAFKRILGGCHTVVEGLGTIRNRLGDAHGKGNRPVRPTSRHAQLAVNLAGAMSTFLIETYRDRAPDPIAVLPVSP